MSNLMLATGKGKVRSLLILTLLLASCGSAERDSEGEAASTEEASATFLSMPEAEQGRLGIKTVTLTPGETGAGVTVYGTIIPDQTTIAEVGPIVPGRVVSVEAALGDTVVSGQVLAVLESNDIGSARSAYRQAKSEADLSEASLARAESLAAENIVPQKEYLQAKADAERARAVLRAAEDQLRLYKIAVDAPDDQSDASYPLLAPFEGSVIERNAVLGELALVEQPLFIVADLRALWLEADVYEKDLASISVGASTGISVAAYPDRLFTGSFSYLGQTMEPTSRTVKARIEIDNAEGLLKPGMFATAVIPSASPSNTLELPEDAVFLFLGERSVFVATDQGFEVRLVETGAAFGGRVPVAAGLSEGERVVTDGGYEIKARLLKSQYGDDD